MITDKQMDDFLDHEPRCNCETCQLVIEHLATSEYGRRLLGYDRIAFQLFDKQNLSRKQVLERPR